MSATITTEDTSEWWRKDAIVVSAAAGLICLMITKTEARKGHLILWLTTSSGAGIGEAIAIRRAALAAIASVNSDVESVLDKSLQQFGDKLYIKHTPAMQQDGMVHNCLI